MEILKVGKKCKWEDIKIGEVFAWDGCWMVMVKLDETQSGLLSSDSYDDGEWSYTKQGFAEFNLSYMVNLYKLPESVQKLWRNYDL